MDAIKQMNPTIWVFAAILIALVLVQSFLFLRLALKFNKKNNLVTKAEIKSAAQTGAIAAFGPSISSIVVALSLIAMVGSATTFMRCGVIGAPGWELMMANIAAQTAGVSFGSAEFTTSIFTFCIFCMILGSAPYFINTMVMLKPLDNMILKRQRKRKQRFPSCHTSAPVQCSVCLVTASVITSRAQQVLLQSQHLQFHTFCLINLPRRQASQLSAASVLQ